MSEVKNERLYVDRKVALTKDDLTEHIKAIGQAIIDEAEHLGADPHKMYIEFTATVQPGEAVTTVKVTYEVYADPRVHIKKWAEEEKAREEDDN